ncbi:MAG: ABC transporter permease [Chloroflexi bacterium]|jgi:NitT/TauT family transport system permease protein|nr:ABC transporter permease [Chloroflexota bacterium]
MTEPLKNEHAQRLSPRISPLLRILYPLGSVILLLALWQVLYSLLKLPAFILPSPKMVWDKFLLILLNGTWWHHLSWTLLEILLGLLIGGLAATLIGYGLSKLSFLERLMAPFLVGSSSLPMVAVAPLLIIWFGAGLGSKVLICSLTVFFPVLVNVLVGLRNTPQELHELMRSLNASPWQKLTMLELPAALPVLLGGLRVGTTLSVIGAIVGELVSSDRGLGFLINVGRGQYDTALVFVAVLSLILMASLLYYVVLLLERRALVWQTWRKDHL